MPWALAKDMDANGARLAHVLYNLLEATRICGILLAPFIPDSCTKLFAQIGADKRVQTWDSAKVWGSRPEDAPVVKGENLFPRIDMDKALEEAPASEGDIESARYYRDVVYALEYKASHLVNTLETYTSAEFCPYPTYADILFSV